MQSQPFGRVAIITDWIRDFGGAERVLQDVVECFPAADIYTSVCIPKNPRAFDFLYGKNVYTSFLQNIPYLNTHPKLVPFLRPAAFEGFDLSGYNLVISLTSAEAKGVLTKPETCHIAYCHTPTRYYWSHAHEYKNMLEFGWLNGIARLVMSPIIRSMRLWDRLAADRADVWIANSEHTRRRIAKYYRREATVVYPGADAERYNLAQSKEPFFLAVSRAIPYKRLDLCVDAFNACGERLIIVSSTKNALAEELMRRSAPNIEWRFEVHDEELATLYGKARAFVFPAEEDFGLVPVEAMLSGTPVIAYGRGGATETVQSGINGVFFNEATQDALITAIRQFETTTFDPQTVRESAMPFSREAFKKNLLATVAEEVQKHKEFYGS